MMRMNDVIHAMYRKKYERENSYQVCEPYFYRVIGVESEGEYCDALKTLEDYMKRHPNETIFFENNLSINVDFEFINTIKQELSRMNVYRLSTQDISVFESNDLNQCYLKALEKVVNLALSQEQFFSDHTRNEFIAKLLIWSYQFLTSLDFEGHYLPKCIYYGYIERHVIYFLMVAYQMGMDVLYLNPLKEELFQAVDTQSWSILCQFMGVLPIETFNDYAKQGTVLNRMTTTTKTIQQEFHDSFFDETGIFKPWQFRQGTTQPLVLDTILEDIFVYWNEQARMRQGFMTTKEGVVSVPCFFYKVDGIYQDTSKYKRLVAYCSQSSHTILSVLKDTKQPIISESEMYALTFCQLSDASFDGSELKKLPFYRYHKYDESVQDLITTKINECLKMKNLFANPLTREEMIRFCYFMLTLDEQVIRLIDNFDFPMNIPKVVVFLEREAELTKEECWRLAFFNRVGFDVVIFNPSGMFNLNIYLDKQLFLRTRLEYMDYESTYQKVINKKEKKENLITKWSTRFF